MRIIVGHNAYQQPGGEDFLFKCETTMLKEKGHDVYLYERSNHEIKPGLVGALTQALALRSSRQSYDQVSTLIKAFKPDIVHLHNTFFMITPSAFQACHDLGVKVVVSLHNFRLMCINGLFFRDHKPCEQCLSGSRFNGVKHRCYRGSLVSSLLINDMIGHHWNKGTWQEGVNRYIVATEFSRQKHIQAGLPAAKIDVVPHFVEDQGEMVAPTQRGGYALYAGRLSPEKGVHFLLKAWEKIKSTPLYIVGKGPEAQAMQAYIASKGLTHVKMLGFLDREAYVDVFKKAKFLVVPNLCYDNFPMVVVEAYMYGVPVIASRLGTLETSVVDGSTGLLFKMGDELDFINKVEQVAQNETNYVTMCTHARKAFEANYTAQHHYEALMSVYQRAIHE